MLPLLFVLAQPPAAGVPPAQTAPPLVRTPRPEGLSPFDPALLSVQRLNGTWQVMMGPFGFRDTGHVEEDATKIVAVLTALAPMQWGAIGVPKPAVEYGLTDGQPRPTLGPASDPGIDAKSARVELVRGVWVLRDDASIVLNFGTKKNDAEQAAAVVKKYGFNRVGSVGKNGPVLTYLYLSPQPAPAPQGLAAVKGVQDAMLTRVGLQVPGLGTAGEKFRIDPRKLEHRQDRGEWVLLHGADAVANFGRDESAARDAEDLLKHGRAAECCRIGGLIFFVGHDQKPLRVPFQNQLASVDPAGLKPREFAGKWNVADPVGKPLLPAASKEEAEQMIAVMKWYGLDALGRVGSPGKGWTFAGKGR